ncbi:hypothetical protein ACG7TL_008116 [Trametes sanguinea]
MSNSSYPTVVVANQEQAWRDEQFGPISSRSVGPHFRLQYRNRFTMSQTDRALNPSGTYISPDADPSSQTTIIPHNQQPLVIRTYPSESQLERSIQYAAVAQEKWARVPLSQRIAIGRRFMEEFSNMRDEIPLELTLQMGRPVSQGAGEIRGTLERAEYMLSIAESALADVSLKDTDKPGFRRFIKRVPLGVVFVIAPWNYPYLVMVNSVLPALIAGNAVILKPSPQTPLAAERFASAFHKAGVPKDALQVIHLSPQLTTTAVKHPLVDFVAFTGSVSGGRAVDIAAAEAQGFKGVGLEVCSLQIALGESTVTEHKQLGGKDPAYVRADADLDYTVAELVDGAMFNSGQSCCAVEKYRLGDPTEARTNLGPVVSVASADRIRKQVTAAVQAGAKALIPEELFAEAQPGTAYVAPQVLVDVNHTMDVMMEETFGPVVGIQKVVSDEEAIALMNDSPYGLTASIWTNAEKNPESQEAFLRLVDELHTGTVYLNRCDYLDPALAWTGVKNSGRGISLSKFDNRGPTLAPYASTEWAQPLTWLLGRVDEPGTEREEGEALVAELGCVLRHGGVESGLGDAVGRLDQESRLEEEVVVRDARRDRDDFLRGAFAEERQEGVDGVDDADDVDAELRDQGVSSDGRVVRARRAYQVDEVCLQELLVWTVEAPLSR